jgi:crotonobetaine/carnitine-CoA ligase
MTDVRDARGMPTLPADLQRLNVRDFIEAAAAQVPDRPALVTRAGTLTYAELDRRVDLAASAWLALGVRKGDRVAFLVENSDAFVTTWLGLAKIGAVLVAINTRFNANEVRAMLEVGKPQLLVAGEPQLETARAAASGFDAAVRSIDEVLAIAEQASRSFERPPLAADDVISLIFTSGTTGRSKAVMQTHANYVLTGQAYPYWLELDEGTRFYCCLPLFHVNAQAYQTMGMIGNRGTLVLVERFSASRFWDDIRAHRVNVVNYIGAMIAILTKREPSAEERDHELRIAYGAPKFPEEQLQTIEERFGITLVSGFGMSETTFGLVESLRERRPESIGRPRLHPDDRLTNEARVVDGDGRDVPVGEVGELVLRNAMIMKGYFDDPARTGEAIRAGWLYTGDYVSRDTDGFYYYVDRKKDIVRHRGENVSSLEVELTLADHPAVEEAAVVGVPAELTDEDVLAFVVLATGQTAEPSELVEWCRDRLSAYKVPRYLQIVSELPKTPTQKVEKQRLRTEVADPYGWYDSGAERA